MLNTRTEGSLHTNVFDDAKPKNRLSWLAASTQLAISIALLYAAHAHLIHPFRFLDSVLRYQLTTPFFSQFIAWYLPYLQLLLSLNLLFNRFRKPSLLICCVLFLFFCSAQISVLIRGMEIDCGCFGDQASPVSLKTLALSTSLLIMSTISYRLSD